MTKIEAVTYALEFLEKHRYTEYPDKGFTLCSGCGRVMAARTAWTHNPDCPILEAIEALKRMKEEEE